MCSGSCFNLEFPNDVFTFNIRSVIHFEFMFVKGVRFVSRFYFFFYRMDVQLLVAPFFEKTVSVALCYLHSFVRVTRLYVGLFLASVSVQLVHLSILLPVPSVWVTVAVQ